MGKTAIGRDFLAISRRQPLDVVRGAVRERSRQAAVPVQGLAVRHLADRHAVEDEPDGLGDPRLRSRDRLSALPGRLVQSGARPDGDVHRRRRNVCAAGRDRPHPDRRRPRPRHRAGRRQDRAGAAIRGQHHRRASDLRDPDRTLATAGGVRRKARSLPVYRLDAVRAASRPARELPNSPPPISTRTSTAR